mgnify:CR=1 FL=1
MVQATEAPYSGLLEPSQVIADLSATIIVDHSGIVWLVQTSSREGLSAREMRKINTYLDLLLSVVQDKPVQDISRPLKTKDCLVPISAKEHLPSQGDCRLQHCWKQCIRNVVISG